MLVQRHVRRNREITGPTPHAVAIRAKMPGAKPREHLTLERRRKEDVREENLNIVKYNHLFDLKNKWELQTEKQIQKNVVRRRIDGVLASEEELLDQRRLRLRDLLQQEEDDYIREMEAQVETTEERQEKMSARAKQLKAKREAERQKIVEAKLEQQWREQCEELRSVVSRRHQDEVSVDRMQQIAVKSDLEKRRLEDERMYALLWEKDRLSKAAREEQEAKEKIERNRGMVKVLRMQKASHQAFKEEEERLRKEEARLLVEERKLRELEEERMLQHKKSEQNKQKNSLNKMMKFKLQRLAKERQEELALDMKILEQLLQESRDEATELAQRKLQRKEENARYMEYLQQQVEDEKNQEQELQRLLDADITESWKKKIAQWKLEKEARNRLMMEVMATRRIQLQEKLQELAKERAELQRDRAEIARQVEENKRLEDERIARVNAINKEHQTDLLEQINYQKQQQTLEEEEVRREHEEGVQAEQAYQQRLRKVLSSPSAHARTHPMRAQHLGLQVVGNTLKK